MRSTDQKRRASGTGRDYSTGIGITGGGAVSYLDADREGLCECIEAVTANGDAILFARASNGGALSVRILSGGVTHAHYPATSEALNELLTALGEIAKE